MKIIFMDQNTTMCKALTKELNSLSQLNLNPTWFESPVDISIQHSKLQDLKINNEYGRTAIVSPGNSLGFLGGGLDKFIGQIFDPNGNHTKSEKYIREKLTNGYSPPGIVRIVTIPDEELKGSIAFEKLGANSIIHAPTMRTPVSLINDGMLFAYRLVFDLTWQILSVVDIFNKDTSNDKSDQIETIVLPGLGTGYGKIPYDVCSKSMFAAISIFTSQYTVDEKSVLTLKYLGHKYQSLIKTTENIPSSKYDPQKDELINLFQDKPTATKRQKK